MTETFKQSAARKQIERFVTGVYKSAKWKLPFHTLNRVKRQVRIIDKILKDYALSSNEKFVLRTAAWFQSVGFVMNGKKNVETSAATAEHFLNALCIPKATISEIRKAILSTQQPQRARGVVQRILCDSALFYLGETDFKNQLKQLRKEEELLNGHKIDKMFWLQQCITQLNSHTYFSESVQQRLKQSKQKNLEKLLKAKSKLSDIHATV